MKQVASHQLQVVACHLFTEEQGSRSRSEWKVRQGWRGEVRKLGKLLYTLTVSVLDQKRCKGEGSEQVRFSLCSGTEALFCRVRFSCQLFRVSGRKKRVLRPSSRHRDLDLQRASPLRVFHQSLCQELHQVCPSLPSAGRVVRG